MALKDAEALLTGAIQAEHNKSEPFFQMLVMPSKDSCLALHGATLPVEMIRKQSVSQKRPLVRSQAAVSRRRQSPVTQLFATQQSVSRLCV
ncbi:hypothetical protein WJX82_010818 [Trebouxia sp. C0006]